MAHRNSRSYVVRGETPKRYWTPSQGDVVYISGVKTKLGKPWHGEGSTLFPLKPAVHGTTAMSARNILQVARVEEGKGIESVGSTATFSRRSNPRQRKTRDVWVVQGNYGYGHGWEDVTAEETWKEIRQRVKEYRENEPGTPFRVKLTREKIETGQQNPAGPSAIPAKWTPATVTRKGGQIQIRMGSRR